MAVERAIGRNGWREEGGGAGECGGRSRWLGASVGGVLVRKPQELAGKRLTQEISRRFTIIANITFRNRFAKISFGGSFFGLENRRDARAPLSGGFENQDATVIQMDF